MAKDRQISTSKAQTWRPLTLHLEPSNLSLHVPDIEELLKQLETRAAQRKLFTHRPYGHPDTLCPNGALWKINNASGLWGDWSNRTWQTDFHYAGKENQERMLICANRVGKSESGGYEAALHMTGEYPDDWEGRRFNKPVLLWTGSPTNETSRDIIQKSLIGGTGPDELGRGFIPRENIVGKPAMRQAGVSNVVDAFKVRHISGGISTCILKTYEQGWRKWQGTEPDVVWMDEEPDDYKIYLEALTRLLTSHGLMMVTFTPLLGQTTLVRHFHDATHDGVWLGHATWEDAPHLLKEECARMAASYPSWQLQARTMGVPMMGEGAIFTVPESEIIIDPIKIPSFWQQIKAIDFGMGHPFGYTRLAYDRDNDIVYMTDCYRKAEKLAPYHAERVKGTSNWIPVAWPHDGHKRDSKGVEYQKVYKRLGLNMMAKSARYNSEKGGPQGVWPIIETLKEREETGRFKVFSNCSEYLEERRNYHIKRDKNDVAEIVVRRDDTLKACFYGLMMLRKAKTFRASTQRSSPPPRSIMSNQI